MKRMNKCYCTAEEAPWFTDLDESHYINCSCDKLTHLAFFINPVFGSKCKIKNIQNKSMEEIITELKNIPEIPDFAKSRKPFNYIYHFILNPANKNMKMISFRYCSTCDILYSSITKTHYKWFGITYKTKVVRKIIDVDKNY